MAERLQATVEEEARRRRLMLNSKLELAGLAFGFFMAGFIIASCMLAFAEFPTLMGQGDGLRFHVR